MPEFVDVGINVPNFLWVRQCQSLLLCVWLCRSSLMCAVALSFCWMLFLLWHWQWHCLILSDAFLVGTLALTLQVVSFRHDINGNALLWLLDSPSLSQNTNKEKYYRGLMDSFLGLPLKLLVRLLVRWTLRSRTTERTRVIVLGHMTQWGHCNRSYDSMSVVSVPPETDGIGK